MQKYGKIKNNKIINKLNFINIRIFNYMEKILDKNIEIAKDIINQEVEKAGYKVESIYLFGSRARGDYKKYSDYDFLVVINNDIIRAKRIDMIYNIGLRLSNYIASDVIIKSKQKLSQEKDDKGLLSYYALKEGIHLG